VAISPAARMRHSVLLSAIMYRETTCVALPERELVIVPTGVL
jgi:hypothetical protein